MRSDARRPGARSPVATDQQAITLTESENDGTATSLTVDHYSPLRAEMERHKEMSGRSLTDLTVLSAQHDPYRIDTPARHRDGRWFADALDAVNVTGTIHLRGAHYRLIGHPCPDGTPYENTDAQWTWLQEHAAKAARWLGYVDFASIVDNRNAEPVILEHDHPEPEPMVTDDLWLEVPNVAEGLRVSVAALDFAGRQPYRLAMMGEKSSLRETLEPIARRYHADLYLPTGEPTDSMLHGLAQRAADDGRPLAVLYFSDADPAGWQMPLSVCQKLRAFRTMLFPDLDFELYRVALTPEQVAEYDLPSTPLKATEKRADAWRTAMETEQTEIDALASLRPDLLRQLAEGALGQFFDRTLARRVDEAKAAWEAQAQAVLDEHLADADLADLADEIDRVGRQLRQAVDGARRRVRAVVDDVELPAMVVPEPTMLERHGWPLVDSRWSFIAQCDALKSSKAYLEGVG